MADFFDHESATDLKLLHSSVRTHAELENVVNQVEWEIIDFYSYREGMGVATYSDFFTYEAGGDPNNEIKVRLVGYDQDTPTDSEADLKAQLKRTIADVASWVLRNYDNTQGAKNLGQGSRNVTRMSHAIDWRNFPDGWRKRLKNFDARVGQYGI